MVKIDEIDLICSQAVDKASDALYDEGIQLDELDLEKVWEKVAGMLGVEKNLQMNSAAQNQILEEATFEELLAYYKKALVIEYCNQQLTSIIGETEFLECIGADSWRMGVYINKNSFKIFKSDFMTPDNYFRDAELLYHFPNRQDYGNASNTQYDGIEDDTLERMGLSLTEEERVDLPATLEKLNRTAEFENLKNQIEFENWASLYEDEWEGDVENTLATFLKHRL